MVYEHLCFRFNQWFQTSDVYFCFNLLSGSRRQMYIYVLACSVVLDVRCILWFSLFSGSRCQMYIYVQFVQWFQKSEVLLCSRRRVYIYVLTCSVVLEVRCTVMFQLVQWFLMSHVYLCFSFFSGSRSQMHSYVLASSVVLDVRYIFMFQLVQWFQMSDIYLCFSLFSGSRVRCIFMLQLVRWFQTSDIYLCVSLFSSSRCQMHIYVLACSVILDVICIFIF